MEKKNLPFRPDGSDLKICFLSGLTIVERRIRSALTPIWPHMTIRTVGRAHPSEIRAKNLLADTTLLIVGPDVPFNEALEIAREAVILDEDYPVVFIREEHHVAHIQSAAKAGTRAYVLFPFELELFREQVRLLFVKSPLADIPVLKLMEPVTAIREDETVVKAAEHLTSLNMSGAPVIALDGEMVGFISSKDLLVAFRLRGYEANNMTIGRFISRKLVTLPDTAMLEDAIELFVRHGVHVLPILKNGKPIGLVKRMDVLRSILLSRGA